MADEYDQNLTNMFLKDHPHGSFEEYQAWIQNRSSGGPTASVHPLPRHRFNEARSNAGKHRAEGGSLHFMVHNCEELKAAINQLQPKDEKTREYFIKKAQQFGCLENIPYSWIDDIPDRPLGA